MIGEKMQSREDGSSKRWLRPAQAADYLGLAVSTLAKMRVTGEGPVFHKLTTRSVAYDCRELDAWLEARQRTSTSDSGNAQ